jgi:hypothetical protein
MIVTLSFIGKEIAAKKALQACNFVCFSREDNTSVLSSQTIRARILL